jgi:hypothetical protein
MTTMKTTLSILLTLSSFFLLTTAFAQNSGKTASERAENKTKKMTAELVLSSEQSTTLLDLNLRTIQKLDEAKLDKATYEAKKLEIEKEYETELKSILTSEQYKRYEAIKVRREKAKNTNSK